MGVKGLVEKMGYTAHIRSRGQENQEKERAARFKARRWVLEVCHSWLNGEKIA
jgi:hypothetical protein